jgi:hypothetical protein
VAQDATPASPKPARSSAIKRSSTATRSGRVVKKTGRGSNAPVLPPEVLAAAAAGASPASAKAKGKPGPKPGAKKAGRKPGRPPKTAASPAKRSPGRPPKAATPAAAAAAASAVAVAAAAASVKSPSVRGGVSKKKQAPAKHTTPSKRAKQAAKLPKVEKRRVGRPSSKAAKRK